MPFFSGLVNTLRMTLKLVSPGTSLPATLDIASAARPSRNGTRTLSKVPEVWQAFFQEGFHALFLVFGRERAVKQPALEL